jgi:Mlc titration factor MtfA (ptsG expression regulator)
MAHILDAEDGIFDGQPLLDDRARGPAWARTLDREFAIQREAYESAQDGPLNDYAGRNPAEFFAVATEAYFCTPNRLRERLPDLYVELSRFFQR